MYKTHTTWNERKEGKKWITASWIDYYFKGIEEENSNVAIMLMAIQLSSETCRDKTNFFIEKHRTVRKKYTLKPFLAYALSIHVHTKPAAAKESEYRQKRVCLARQYAHIRSFCFLIFSHTSRHDDSV